MDEQQEYQTNAARCRDGAPEIQNRRSVAGAVRSAVPYRSRRFVLALGGSSEATASNRQTPQ
ncbi:uncharacterized protein LOC116806334 isoform X17 [Drosophila grimshawi]|uniref:uncharacterized protein LOC116806334 isoform X17 n=1 Tax=Drosophila grimshawi TaxID=7222 RepID=UPI001C9320FE|nr:uncharacterized protein LOC116806334 isoform X17 [Drosophila grimshawi]